MNDTMFVLEDMEERMPTFIKIAKALNMELHHVETVPHGEASFLVKDPKIAFLDHDLGGKIFVDSNKEQTGVHFAKWIAENDESYKDRIIIVHSMNPYGAIDINNALGGFANIVSFRDIYFNSKKMIELLTKLLRDSKM